MAGKRKDIIGPGTVVLLLSIVLVSGCITVQIAPPGTPVPVVTTDPGQVPTIAPTSQPVTTTVPVTTGTTVLQQTTTAAPQPETITADLAYGITISYPRDWMLEETGLNVSRDYGRDVISVANLYSPALSRGRKMPGPNPDTSDNTILTIDVDDAGAEDFDTYFNHVILALQDEYGSIDITRHNAQLMISGYSSYILDFDAGDLRGEYIFTDVDGTMYIFSFSNPTPHSSEVEAMYRSIIISR